MNDQLMPGEQAPRRSMLVPVIIGASALLITIGGVAYYTWSRSRSTATPLTENALPGQSSPALNLPSLNTVQPTQSTQPTEATSTPPATTTPSPSISTTGQPTIQQKIEMETETTTSTAAVTTPQTPSQQVLVREANRPKLTIGDTWTWSGRTETYTGEADGLLVFTLTKKTGEVLRRYRSYDLNVVKDTNAQGVTIDTRTPDTGMLAFPLTVGKQWTHHYLADTTARTATYKVTGYVTLLTTTGQFKTFKIEGVDKRDDRKYGVAVTLWYAPKAKTVAQSKGIDQSSDKPVTGWNYVLTSYHVNK